MTPGASVRSAKNRTQRSSRRSSARRVKQASGRKRYRRRRRVLVIGGVLLAGIAIGVVIAHRDELGRTVGKFPLELTLPLRHEDIIRQQAADKGVDADLIAAVIWQESKFRDQTSNAGARGLMQITPSTADVIERLSGGQTFEFNDLANPDLNIRYGTFYLRYLLDKFDGNTVAALAAYNAGETNVAAWGGSDLTEDNIQFPETREYVDNVLAKRDDYRDHYGDELGLN
jgi:soluble lytic murein transglycosylase